MSYRLNILGLLASLTLPLACAWADAPPTAAKGAMLASADGARIGAVYRVTTDGSPQVIVDGKMVTVPASTLSMVDGKLTTSLKKNEITSLR